MCRMHYHQCCLLEFHSSVALLALHCQELIEALLSSFFSTVDSNVIKPNEMKAALHLIRYYPKFVSTVDGLHTPARYRSLTLRRDVTVTDNGLRSGLQRCFISTYSTCMNNKIIFYCWYGTTGIPDRHSIIVRQHCLTLYVCEAGEHTFSNTCIVFWYSFASKEVHSFQDSFYLLWDLNIWTCWGNGENYAVWGIMHFW